MTVTVPGVLPVRALTGVTAAMLGDGFKIFSGNVLEEPPPGGGFTGFITVICRTPGIIASAALSTVSTNVESTNVVVRLLPLTVTVDCATKFVPITFSCTPELPVGTPDGDSEEIFGTGLTVGLIVKITPKVVPPPG